MASQTHSRPSANASGDLTPFPSLDGMRMRWGGREHHSGVPQLRVLQNRAIDHHFPQSKPVPRTPFIQDSLLEGPGMYSSGKAVCSPPKGGGDLRGALTGRSKGGLAVLTQVMCLRESLSLTMPPCPHLSKGKESPQCGGRGVQRAAMHTAQGQAHTSPSGGRRLLRPILGHLHMCLPFAKPTSFLLRHHPLRCSLAQRSAEHGHRPFMGLGRRSKCRLQALPLTHGIRTLGADPGVYTLEPPKLGSTSRRPDLSQTLALVPISDPAMRWKVGWISESLGAVWRDAHRAPNGRHPLM